MGCGSSTSAHAIHSPGVNVVPMKNDFKQAAIEEMTDDARSKNSTPVNINNGELGETVETSQTPTGHTVSPETPSDTTSSPKMLPTTPRQIMASPAKFQPLDVDSLQLPTQEPESFIPHWERDAPLSALGSRSGTNSQRPQAEAGKIKIYQTAAQKRLAAENKKKRQSDSPTSAKTLPPVAGPRSALPPLKERKKKSCKSSAAADHSLPLAPDAKKGFCMDVNISELT